MFIYDNLNLLHMSGYTKFINDALQYFFFSARINQENIDYPFFILIQPVSHRDCWVLTFLILLLLGVTAVTV